MQDIGRSTSYRQNLMALHNSFIAWWQFERAYYRMWCKETPDYGSRVHISLVRTLGSFVHFPRYTRIPRVYLRATGFRGSSLAVAGCFMPARAPKFSAIPCAGLNFAFKWRLGQYLVLRNYENDPPCQLCLTWPSGWWKPNLVFPVPYFGCIYSSS